jgi:hypothetical protein
MLYGVDQPGCEVARAFFEVLYRTPPISSTPDECGCRGRNVNLDLSDPGVRIMAFRPPEHEDNRFAGLYDRKAFSNRCYDRPSSNRPSGGGVVREMNRCHAPNR